MYARLHVEKWYTEHFEHLNIFFIISPSREWFLSLSFYGTQNSCCYGARITILMVQKQLFLWYKNNGY